MIKFYLMVLYSIANTLLTTQIQPVTLGETTVYIVKQSANTGKTFIHLHQNEITALQAAKYMVDNEGGTLITLLHPGQRNIVFYMDGQKFEFDPNRIFSEAGIKKTMKMFGGYNSKAHQVVKQLADQILNFLPEGKVIAVHNNNQEYSIKEYFPGNTLSSDVKRYHYCVDSNVRNFYFVTQEQEFIRLRDEGHNVALQGESAENDGSLSFCLSKDNYVNVEAAYGALEAQVAMLKLA